MQAESVMCLNTSTTQRDGTHPRRPRGSQWGREKRRDESFQVRPDLLENFRSAVSPDPTDGPWVSEDGRDSMFWTVNYAFLWAHILFFYKVIHHCVVSELSVLIC